MLQPHRSSVSPDLHTDERSIMMNHSTNKVRLEVCVDSLASSLIAAQAGAARIEINSALELGGLTCSIGLAQEVVDQLKPTECEVIAMVRPRPGGFAYQADELNVMQRDIEALLQLGVDGIALGVLTSNGNIDVESTDKLIKPILAAGKQVVFHRAFDLVANPNEALGTLIELGFTRVLTSGQAPTAMQGASLIRTLIEQANGRIEILPGSGISPSNVAALTEATGCDQVHASLRHVVEDCSSPTPSTITFHSNPPADGNYHQTDPDKVAQMLIALNQGRDDGHP